MLLLHRPKLKVKMLTLLSKHFVERTYLDNMSQLEIELRKESSMFTPRKNFYKKVVRNSK